MGGVSKGTCQGHVRDKPEKEVTEQEAARKESSRRTSPISDECWMPEAWMLVWELASVKGWRIGGGWPGTWVLDGNIMTMAQHC